MVVQQLHERIYPSPVLILQVEMPSHLTFDGGHRSIREPALRLSIERYANGKSAGLIAPDNLNASDGFTARPLPDRFQALLSESLVF